MKVQEFRFHLPVSLIPQRQNRNPRETGLLVLSRKEGKINHRSFNDFPSFLNKGDLVVLNNSRVVASRVWGLLEFGGQAELNLISRLSGGLWEALIRPDIGLKKDSRIFLKGKKLKARLIKRTGYGGWLLRFNRAQEGFLRKTAEINTPFYIKKTINLPDYQNIYASHPGSVQCPTSGLHFTDSILGKIKMRGADTAFITLHVSGSILPINVDDYRDLRIPKEYFEVNKETAEKIDKAKKNGSRVIAVGTTVARALETAAGKGGRVKARKGWTKLSIRPDYRFKAIDALLTNLHLPCSSHLALTSAFAGASKTLEAYRCALRKRYRFLDFGDAMLII